MNLTGLRVFLAAPYSQWMNPATGQVHEHRRDRLDALRVSFMSAGARVFSAHYNERWGAGWLPADQCTPADFQTTTAHGGEEFFAEAVARMAEILDAGPVASPHGCAESAFVGFVEG